jgi:hypothetical protein
LRDIYFADSNNGWILCERNLYQLKSNAEPRTYLMNTTDGGEKWQRVMIPRADVNARLVRAVFSPSGCIRPRGICCSAEPSSTIIAAG